MNLAELERAELEAALVELGLPKFHGRQIFQWVYQRGETDFEKMTNLARPLRARPRSTSFHSPPGPPSISRPLDS